MAEHMFYLFWQMKDASGSCRVVLNCTYLFGTTFQHCAISTDIQPEISLNKKCLLSSFSKAHGNIGYDPRQLNMAVTFQPLFCQLKNN